MSIGRRTVLIFRVTRSDLHRSLGHFRFDIIQLKSIRQSSSYPLNDSSDVEFIIDNDETSELLLTNGQPRAVLVDKGIHNITVINTTRAIINNARQTLLQVKRIVKRFIPAPPLV